MRLASYLACLFLVAAVLTGGARATASDDATVAQNWAIAAIVLASLAIVAGIALLLYVFYVKRHHHGYLQKGGSEVYSPEPASIPAGDMRALLASGAV